MFRPVTAIIRIYKNVKKANGFHGLFMKTIYLRSIISYLYRAWRTARGSAVGWGTALQAGRSRVRFPMVSFSFFIVIILPAALRPLGLTQPLTEINTWGYLLGVQMRRPDLTTFMCRLFWNLEASTFWNSQGLSRSVMGLLYLLQRLVNGVIYVACRNVLPAFDGVLIQFISTNNWM